MTVYQDTNHNEYEVISGVLHIRKGSAGTGVMPNFTSSSRVKELVNNESYMTVVIESGITTIGIYAFHTDTAITDVNIPNTVTSIGNYVFRRCSSLISVTIGYGITSIGGSAFDGCTSLTSVTMKGTIPPTVTTTSFPTTTTIYVPYGSASAYKSSWSAYANQIVELPNPIKKMKLVTAVKSANLAKIEDGSYSNGSDVSITVNKGRYTVALSPLETNWKIVKLTGTPNNKSVAVSLADMDTKSADGDVIMEAGKTYSYSISASDSTIVNARYACDGTQRIGLSASGTVTPEFDVKAIWLRFTNNYVDTGTYTIECMINEGITALPYEPYGDRTIPMKLVTSIVPNAITVNKTGHSSQTGTPTPDAPIPVVSDTYYDSDGNPVELRSVGTYADTYDATTHTITRNVVKYVLDGTENYAWNNPSIGITSSTKFETMATGTPPLSTHFVGATSTADSKIVVYTATTLRVRKAGWTGSADAKNWFTDQNANGNPVITLCPLATPTTETKVLYDAPMRTIPLKLITES